MTAAESIAPYFRYSVCLNEGPKTIIFLSSLFTSVQVLPTYQLWHLALPEQLHYLKSDLYYHFSETSNNAWITTLNEQLLTVVTAAVFQAASQS